MLTPDQEKLKEAAERLKESGWSADGAVVFAGDGDSVCACNTALGNMPEPIFADERAEFISLANPAAILAILAQLEQVQGWVSVDAEQKPTGRKPILVAVSCIKFGEYEDGTPGEGHSRVVTEGEYIPKHGDSGDYFTAYASPMADQEWITHWRELPPPPEAA